MTKEIDPEKSMVERAHREHSTMMEVLIRLPFHPYDVSLKQIAKDIFRNEFKYPIIRDMIGRLKMSGYGIRTYIGPKKQPCFYIEDGPKFTRKEASDKAKAYEATVYCKHHVPLSQTLKNQKPKPKKSWPGYFDITHTKSKVISKRSCMSGYTPESKRKHNETLRIKKEDACGNPI